MIGEPGLDQEKALLGKGFRLIAGVDEAGRGAWAGPVYAAAVVLPLDQPDLMDALNGVADSKQLSPGRRETLLRVIKDVALCVGVGASTAAEIDVLGIAPATRLAMRRAVEALSPAPEALLLDYVTLPELSLPQRSLPKADRLCLSVAAASIVAKVSRDQLMVELDARYPGYGFARHKGYGTAAHRSALAQLGPSPEHRMSWTPLQSLDEQPEPYQSRPLQSDVRMESPTGSKCDDVVIRPFQPEDQAVAQRLILAGLEERWGFLDPTKNPDLENIASTYADVTFLVAWQGDELVGTGALVHERDGVARVVRMSVAAHKRRRGIGTLILRRLCEQAQAAGYRQIVLETTCTWDDAIAFYERNGFRVVGSYDGDTHFVLDLA